MVHVLPAKVAEAMVASTSARDGRIVLHSIKGRIDAPTGVLVLREELTPAKRPD